MAHARYGRYILIVLLAAAVFAYLALPSVSLAKDDDLRAVIRGAILADPRSASMTSAEVDAMVDLLGQEAESKGIRAEDISWLPVGQYPAAPASACGGVPAFLCAFNQALGFDGSDLAIPIIFGVAGAPLLFVLGMMIERERSKRVPAMRPQASPISGPL